MLSAQTVRTLKAAGCGSPCSAGGPKPAPRGSSMKKVKTKKAGCSSSGSGPKMAPRYSETKKLEKKARASLVYRIAALHKSASARKHPASKMLAKLACDIAAGKPVLQAVKQAAPQLSAEKQAVVAVKLASLVKNAFGGAINFQSKPNISGPLTRQDFGAAGGAALGGLGAAADAVKNTAGRAYTGLQNAGDAAMTGYKNWTGPTDTSYGQFRDRVGNLVRGTTAAIRQQPGAPAPAVQMQRVRPNYTPAAAQQRTYTPTNDMATAGRQLGRRAGTAAAGAVADAYTGAGQALNEGLVDPSIRGARFGGTVAKNLSSGLIPTMQQIQDKAMGRQPTPVPLQTPSLGPQTTMSAATAAGNAVGRPQQSAAMRQGQDPLASLPPWIRAEFQRRQNAGGQQWSAGQVANKWREMNPAQQLAMQQAYQQQQLAQSAPMGAPRG